jgi:hypothetical protein
MRGAPALVVLSLLPLAAWPCATPPPHTTPAEKPSRAILPLELALELELEKSPP